LAAILAADVVGSSRLIEADEAHALAVISEVLHEVLVATARQHGGRLIKTMGDGALLEFASPVSAVTCAVEVQKLVAERASTEPEDRRVLLRMGVNLGDVVAQADGDLYGDGVNVAAHLEGLADPGGIAISAKIYDELQGKLALSFEDRGEQRLKNIARPIRVYTVAGAASAKPKSLPLPDKPSVAVLPFTNMSSDPEQDYFADGVVEDIITALSRVKWFFVIARNSSFTYKGKSVDTRQVGRELGVRYVLEGSIRKGGSRVRITGQLIEADTGHHIWADRFDGVLEDIFELQDTITEAVVAAIEPKLRDAELARSLKKPTENLDAYDLYLRSLPHYHQYTKEANEQALSLLGQAIALDPTFALAHAWAAYNTARKLWQNWSEDRAADEALSAAHARTALQHGSDDPDVLWRCAFALAQATGEVEEALALSEKSLALNPNSAEALIRNGWNHVWMRKFDVAIGRFERARRLSPLARFSHGLLAGLATAYMGLGHYERAIAFCRESLSQNPQFVGSYRLLAACCAHLGRVDEARKAVSEALRMAPSSTLSSSTKANLSNVALIEGLRKAGYPE